MEVLLWFWGLDDRWAFNLKFSRHYFWFSLILQAVLSSMTVMILQLSDEALFWAYLRICLSVVTMGISFSAIWLLRPFSDYHRWKFCFSKTGMSLLLLGTINCWVSFYAYSADWEKNTETAKRLASIQNNIYLMFCLPVVINCIGLFICKLGGALIVLVCPSRYYKA